MVSRGYLAAFPGRAEGYIGHHRALVGSGAFLPCIGEQRVIEVRAPDLIAVGVFSIEPGPEVVVDALTGFVRHELRAGLQHAQAGDLFADAQPLENGEVSR